MSGMAGVSVCRKKSPQSVTLYPAQILGVADRLGTLKRKAATLIVTNGDPLDLPTQVETAFIEAARSTCRIGRHNCAINIAKISPQVGPAPIPGDGLPSCREEVLLLDRVDDVGAGLFVVFEFQQAALLRFEKQLVESAKAVRALVESRVLSLDRLLHE